MSMLVHMHHSLFMHVLVEKRGEEGHPLNNFIDENIYYMRKIHL